MNIFNIEELNSEYNYNINAPDDFLKLRYKSTQINILNQLATNFRWESPDIDIPRNLEILLRIKGIMGFVKSDWKFCKLSPVDYDDNNNPLHYVGMGLGTSPKSYGTLSQDEVIPLYNNPLGIPDLLDINYFSYEKAQNDVSRMYQLINSRNIPMLQADSDKELKAILKALEDVKAGKPAVVVTSILKDIEKLDILDPNNISKMEYLTSYDEVLDKNIANRFGASLDIKDKKAQVNTAELKAYDDITTMNYLISYESRLEFVEKMREEGFEIDCIMSPIFADEPDEEEIENPELLEEENLSEDEENLSEDKESEEKEEEDNGEN